MNGVGPGESTDFASGVEDVFLAGFDAWGDLGQVRLCWTYLNCTGRSLLFTNGVAEVLPMVVPENRGRWVESFFTRHAGVLWWRDRWIELKSLVLVLSKKNHKFSWMD